MNQPEDNLTSLKKEIATLRQQNEKLEQRCTEAEDALDAIRSGSVDALVIYSNEGEQVFTIQGAEYSYRVLVEQMNEGAATLIEDGTILYCNARFADMLHAPLEEMIGSSIHLYISPEHRELFFALLKQGLQGNCRNEINLLGKNGDSISVMASLNRFDAVEGQGVCLVASDLTERKKIEEMTRLEALRADAFSEMSKLMVEAGLDTQAIMKVVAHSTVQLIGDICFIHMLSPNRKSLELTAQYPNNEELNDINLSANSPFRTDKGILAKVLQTGEAVLVPSLKSTHEPSITKAECQFFVKHFEATSLLVVPVLTADQPVGTLILARRKNGEPYSLNDQSLAYRIANQMALTILNSQLYKDLQNSLKKEQVMHLQLMQVEKLAALSRMMASIVHEINNPMQSIKNWIYLARAATPENTPTAEYLNLLRVETERISKLVSNMRVFYLPPKKELMRPLDLYGVLRDMRTLLDIHLDHQNITWNQAPSTEPLLVMGVSDEIKQVFLNICLNAIEAMKPKGGKIFISNELNVEKNEVVVSVKNTGPGIKPEVIGRIFEPFFTTKENGTGLGLAICHEIIQRHSGHISVESEPDQGATFIVRLPYYNSKDPK